MSAFFNVQQLLCHGSSDRLRMEWDVCTPALELASH